MINSLHHQAVMQENSAIRVGARADDGVIEAIEASGHTFCLGVQWHPEYLVNAAEADIFAELVKSAMRLRAAPRTSGASLLLANG
jgi:putative glutamine amidotransferase